MSESNLKSRTIDQASLLALMSVSASESSVAWPTALVKGFLALGTSLVIHIGLLILAIVYGYVNYQPSMFVQPELQTTIELELTPYTHSQGLPRELVENSIDPAAISSAASMREIDPLLKGLLSADATSGSAVPAELDPTESQSLMPERFTTSENWVPSLQASDSSAPVRRSFSAEAQQHSPTRPESVALELSREVDSGARFALPEQVESVELSAADRELSDTKASISAVADSFSYQKVEQEQSRGVELRDSSLPTPDVGDAMAGQSTQPMATKIDIAINQNQNQTSLVAVPRLPAEQPEQIPVTTPGFVEISEPIVPPEAQPLAELLDPSLSDFAVKGQLQSMANRALDPVRTGQAWEDFGQNNLQLPQRVQTPQQPLVPETVFSENEAFPEKAAPQMATSELGSIAEDPAREVLNPLRHPSEFSGLSRVRRGLAVPVPAETKVIETPLLPEFRENKDSGLTQVETPTEAMLSQRSEAAGSAQEPQTFSATTPRIEPNPVARPQVSPLPVTQARPEFLKRNDTLAYEPGSPFPEPLIIPFSPQDQAKGVDLSELVEQARKRIRQHDTAFLIQYPKNIKMPKPLYPRNLERAGIEGDVWLLVKIGASGKVISASIYQSSGYSEFDRSALETVRQHWTYEPATLDGKPVDLEAIIGPIRFTIRYQYENVPR